MQAEMPHGGVPIEQRRAASFADGFRAACSALLGWLGGTALVGVAMSVVLLVVLRPAHLALIGTEVGIGTAVGLFTVASAAFLFAGIRRPWETGRAAAENAIHLERQRLARDLHDGLAQDLAVILAYTQQQSCAIGPNHPVSVAARRALGATRGAITDLSASGAPTVADALHQTAEELQARFGVAVKVLIARRLSAEDQTLLAAEGREHLIRIAREAIVNAARHGAACQIDVTLDRDLGGVRLRVVDDGCGLKPETQGGSSGTRLLTMHLRAAALGGEFRARALPDCGTEIEVLIPVRGKIENRGAGGSQRWRIGIPRVATVAVAGLIAAVSVITAGSEARQSGPQSAPRHPNHRIWVPAPDSTWQWQLTTPVDTSVKARVYDIDLFENPASVVRALRREGRKVICYLDAGTYENYRPDAWRFPRSVLGKPNGWPGERWLDIRRLSVLAPIMRARFELCKQKGFDGVEADNVDAYQNDSGFPLTASDQLNYNRWLARTAHSLGLSIALKNDVDQAAQLEPYFDYELDEQCFQYAECGQLRPFVAAHKAVFEVEYDLPPSQFCTRANADGFMAMRKDLDLDAWRKPCWQ